MCHCATRDLDRPGMIHNNVAKKKEEKECMHTCMQRGTLGPLTLCVCFLPHLIACTSASQCSHSQRAAHTHNTQQANTHHTQSVALNSRKNILVLMISTLHTRTHTHAHAHANAKIHQATTTTCPFNYLAWSDEKTEGCPQQQHQIPDSCVRPDSCYPVSVRAF